MDYVKVYVCKKIKYILVLLIFLCINITCGCYVVDCKYSEELIQTINEDDEVRFEYLISKKGNLDSKPYVFGIDRVNLPPYIMHVKWVNMNMWLS